MRKLPLLAALFALAVLLLPTSAHAQSCGAGNPNCIVPTAPVAANNNQAASTAFVVRAIGNLGSITALTGDGTATGPGSVPFTLSTVNANVGSFGSATQCVSLTTNAKGLITAASAVACTPPFSSLTGAASAAQIAASPASHAVPVDVAGTPTWSIIPNCIDSVGQHINYTQSSDAWSCGTSSSGIVGSVDNLLSNVQWQVTTGIVPAVKQNSTGSGVQTGASCASFDTSNAAPTFHSCTTQQIKVGDLVVVATSAAFSTAAYDNFWGLPGPGYISCNTGTVFCQPTAGTATNCAINHNTCYLMPGLVIAVVANTSITIQGYFGAVSPAASSATVLYPIVRGDTSGGTSVNCPDGWSKTASLISAQDDFSAHVYPGALRVLYMRGGITGTESCTYTVPGSSGPTSSPGNLARYQGQTVTFGVVANQTVQGGANTWNISITDSSGTSTSSNGTGSGFGGYQFLTVTRTIAQNATSVSFSLNKTGNSNDVIYWALPTAAFVPTLVQSQLHQNSNEQISSNGHCNPPLLTPLILQFGTAISTGLYGWTGINMDAISFDCYHSSLGAVWAKVEWTTTSVGADIFTASNLAANDFGPQAATQVSGVHSIGGPSPLWLSHDGTFIMYTGVGSLTPTSGTWDFWNASASVPNSIN